VQKQHETLHLRSVIEHRPDHLSRPARSVRQPVAQDLSQPARSVWQAVAHDWHGPHAGRKKHVPSPHVVYTHDKIMTATIGGGFAPLNEAMWNLGPVRPPPSGRGDVPGRQHARLLQPPLMGCRTAEGTHLNGQSERAVDGCPPARRQDRNPSCCAVASHGDVGMIRI